MAIIHPPKNGTNTVKAIMNQICDGPYDGDHQTYSDMQRDVAHRFPDASNVQYAANVRHPISRLVSAINYTFTGADKRRTEKLDAVMHKIKSGGVKRIYNTQLHWIEKPDEVRLFNMHSMEIIKWLGWSGEVPHENKGRCKWSRQEIEAHPLFNDVADLYADDWQLWNMVK